MGLSFDELNLFRLGDFLDFCDLWAFDPDDPDVVRQATVDEIAAFRW